MASSSASIGNECVFRHPRHKSTKAAPLSPSRNIAMRGHRAKSN